MKKYEVGVKSYLGSPKKADIVLLTMKELYPQTKLVRESEQLHHYFNTGNLQKLLLGLDNVLDTEQIEQLERSLDISNYISVKTSKHNHDVFFILKGNLDKDESAPHDLKRVEFETKLANISQDQLDNLLHRADFDYHSKWNRKRKEYSYKDYNVHVEFTPGYGYTAEIEKVIDNEELLDETKTALMEELKLLNLSELNRDLIERMFEHHTENWQKYYLTKRSSFISS